MKKKRLLTDRSGTLEEELMTKMSMQMQKEMDAEILRSMFKDIGWHEVVLTPMTHERGKEIDYWVQNTVKGRGRWTHGLVWMFEQEQDAMWFKLKWLS
jgi:hypothetical protein